MKIVRFTIPFILGGLSLLSACGDTGASTDAAVESAAAYKQSISGNWQLDHVTCGGDSSTLLTPQMLTGNSYSSTTDLSATNANRIWNESSGCSYTVPLQVQSVTGTDIVLNEEPGVCTSGCEAYCNAASPGVKTYPYSLTANDVLSVQVPDSQASYLCGSSQPQNNVEMVYVKIGN